jgi:hypothetical protein
VLAIIAALLAGCRALPLRSGQVADGDSYLPTA